MSATSANDKSEKFERTSIPIWHRKSLIVRQPLTNQQVLFGCFAQIISTVLSFDKFSYLDFSCKCSLQLIEMAQFKLIVVCLLVAACVRTDALLGFRDSKSFLFREPPVDEDIVRSIDVTEHWITQKLDNFDPTDNRTFQMVR